ncbi:Uncharacterised protein [Comamonas testosteroni]|uniref:Uncharacterized protein n=1 Tax=Comamonas testosteroni TaxID=285 RepID=A0A8B4S529_COMTE|nr:Uncharacterised protein [Comamonas testosteroni]
MRQRPRIYCADNPKIHTLYPNSRSPTSAVKLTSLFNSLTSEYRASRHDT